LWLLLPEPANLLNQLREIFEHFIFDHRWRHGVQDVGGQVEDVEPRAEADLLHGGGPLKESSPATAS